MFDHSPTPTNRWKVIVAADEGNEKGPPAKAAGGGIPLAIDGWRAGSGGRRSAGGRLDGFLDLGDGALHRLLRGELRFLELAGEIAQVVARAAHGIAHHLAESGARRAVEPFHLTIEFLDAPREFVELLAPRHAELGQRARHAVLEHLLQTVPGFLGALAHLGHAVLDRIAHLADRAARDLARLLLQLTAFLDQRLEQPAAFLLRLGEGA